MSLKTELAKRGYGEIVSRDRTMDLFYLHDILEIARQQAMTVRMLVGSVREQAWDTVPKTVLGFTLSDLIAEVVFGGAKVSVLAKQTTAGLYLAPSLEKLMRGEGVSPNFKEHFWLGVTGKEMPETPSFVVAVNESNLPNVWNIMVTGESGTVVLFGTNQARMYTAKFDALKRLIINTTYVL